MTAYRELIERLEKATGPDRELGDAVMCALIDVDDADAKRFYGGGQDFTASIDAALSLVEKMLPGCTRAVDATAPECGITVELFPVDCLIDECVRVDHKSEPIATCIALLRALEAQSKDKEEGE